MMRIFLGRLRSIFDRRRVDAEIDREIRSHLAMEMAHRERRGLPVAEARRTSLSDFGSALSVREQVRDARGLTFVDAIVQDVRFGFRTLGRARGYTATAILILGLGIGANTALFSVIDGVLLKPLPFRNGSELTLIRQAVTGGGTHATGVAIPELADYRRRLMTVRDLVEYHSMSFTLLDHGDPDRVDTAVVSANFFDVLGTRALLGRTFVDADDRDEADAVLVLSHAYWTQKFGGDRNVIGRVVQMNNRPHTIVGVLPDFPQYPRASDVYMPTSACPSRAEASHDLHAGHRTFPLQVFGRLAPGATLDAASAEIDSVAASFERDYPDDYQQSPGMSGSAVSLEDTLVRDARPMLAALSGATLLVLLITCANVANLSLGQTVRRERELAVRTALGASRRRLLRQLITESLIVALAGGALGLAIASMTVDLLKAFVGRFTPRTGEIAIDGGVFAFALVASVMTGLVFGAAPALASRRTPMPLMRDGANAGRTSRRRLRSALVVAQVAVSFVLLIGAALLVASLHRLSAVDLGFGGDRVVTASFFGNFTTMSTRDDVLRIHSGILERLRASPHVLAASVTASVPLSGIVPGPQPIAIEGVPGEAPFEADPNTASDGYFETLQVPLVAGRTFSTSDNASAPPVAVINKSMAVLWGNHDPIGRRFWLLSEPGVIYTVIGVVKDFHLYSADERIAAEYYTTYRQNNGFAGRLLVRTNADPVDVAPLITDAVHAVDPKAPVEGLSTLGDLRRGRLASPALTAVLLGIFAVIALAVTLAGIAGVVGTAVSQRTREFGLRMALGATRGSVLRHVLHEGVSLVCMGVLLGVAGAYAFGRLIEKYLFDTSVADVRAYGAVFVLFLAAALVASFGPARRATSVDPVAALKAE